MSRLFTSFVKLTGYIPQHFFFKKKVYFENEDKSILKLDTPALIVSNHKSVYDYPLMMFTFKEQIHCLVGEHIYQNKALGWFIKHLGNIKVVRESNDFSFIYRTIKLLKQGKTCLIYPEARLHTDKDNKKELLKFKPSFVYIALQAGVPIIPVYTNGIYGKLKKENKSCTKVIIGNKIYPSCLIKKNKSDKKNITNISNYVRDYILKLKKQLERQDNGK